MKETDLFLPIRRLFEDLGYTVHAEVRDCDVTATKDEELIVIELKRNLSVRLLEQALTRQKTGAMVYVAVPKPKNYKPRAYRETLAVIEKLELGLIFVNLLEGNSFAEVVCDPKPYSGVRINSKKRTQLRKEIENRSVGVNQGGSSRQKIVTAYTERCIRIACALQQYGEMSAKELSGLGIDHKAAYHALRANHYGWFYKVEKGVYALTLKARQDLKKYPEFVAYYMALMENNQKGL